MTTRVVDPHIIKSAMKAAKVTAYKVGESVGLSSPQISLMLSGQRNISLNELIAIAGVLNVPWTSLLPALGIQDPTQADAISNLMQRPAVWESKEPDAQTRNLDLTMDAIDHALGFRECDERDEYIEQLERINANLVQALAALHHIKKPRT